MLSVKNHDTPPIIGIGASAGGLEALEAFFSHFPLASGFACVVIQHLDPTYKGMLPELLQRTTPMKVSQVDQPTEILPNCVYVIPPNKDLSILHGILQLLDPIAPRGSRLPINFFFRSLAEDQKSRAVAVILSGMGSDGTLGLQAIKEHAGLTLVQDPSSAKFDGMPGSAIEAGLADIVASAQELPAQIMAYFGQSHQGIVVDVAPIQPLKSQSALGQIIILLREKTGNDFLLYKKNTLYQRIERRMRLHKIDDITDYARYLRKNSQELDLLFKELLIGVTRFFRDAPVWELLKTEIISTLLSKQKTDKTLRAWVPACSTGEEAYTLAIIIMEALTQHHAVKDFSLQIFATDLDPDAINQARQGFFPATISADVSPDRLARFFIPEDNGYRINKNIREMVIFATQNIIMDPPFTKLNIISCRNLLIYLGQELQNKLIPLFHYALAPQGILVLGNAETIGSFTSLFTLKENKSGLYKRNDSSLSNVQVDFPIKYFPITSLANEEPKHLNPMNNLQTFADQILLQNFSPAAVLVNTAGDILYINGRTNKYLEPASGKANWNIYVMLREELRHDLAFAMKKAQHQSEPVILSNLTVGNNGNAQMVTLTVQSIVKPEALRNMLMVVFSESTPSTRKLRRRTPTEAEKLFQAELQQAREEMQSSQEELKSANEELQSTNEELQSTNEELTTSKEEMQSMNEELQTVNTELQSKIQSLTTVNNDMNNLLNSMEIATVFLDNSLNIRRFASHAKDLFKLIACDVGRPLSDIVTDLDYPELQTDTREVLRSLVYTDKLVSANDGRLFRVRIMPYRTQENVIDGVVITFIDISEVKRLEAAFRNKAS